MLIKKLWGVAWEFWEHRNEKEHAHDTTNLNVTTNSLIEVEITTGFTDLCIPFVS
jgi:hypothetical protein